MHQVWLIARDNKTLDTLAKVMVFSDTDHLIAERVAETAQGNYGHIVDSIRAWYPNCIVSMQQHAEPLPKWIDDVKGKDPFTDDLIVYIEGIHPSQQPAAAPDCYHDDTVRQGAIWEVCNQCGKRWADDVNPRSAKKLAAALSTPAIQLQDERQTDLAKRLLAQAEATSGKFPVISILNADLVAICCEANRYYIGMMNWKATAEAKDRAALVAPATQVAAVPEGAAMACLHDVTTHHSDFVAACQYRREACLKEGDEENAAYWAHQIRTLDRMAEQASATLAEPAPQVAAVPFQIEAESLTALRRFYECALDGEDYDVPASTMKVLAGIGLLHHRSAGHYETTEFGLAVLNGEVSSAAAPSPAQPATQDELRQALIELATTQRELVEANAALTAMRMPPSPPADAAPVEAKPVGVIHHYGQSYSFTMYREFAAFGALSQGTYEVYLSPQADTERLDWLEKNGPPELHDMIFFDSPSTASLRNAIDALRGKK